MCPTTVWHTGWTGSRSYGDVVSTATRRRRPLPRRVYWVRRLLVLAVAFGLVYGIAHLLGSGADATRPSARPVGAAASSAAPTGGRPLATAPADAPRHAQRSVRRQRRRRDPVGPRGGVRRKAGDLRDDADHQGRPGLRLGR